MAIIEWKSIYETGIVALDNEHRGLLDGINRLYEAVREKRGTEVTADIITMLEKYTHDHFKHEEKLMTEYQFPDIEEHKKIHKELFESVQNIKTQTDTDPEELAKELLQFLRKWLMDHIVRVDKGYGEFLESRGGRFIE